MHVGALEHLRGRAVLRRLGPLPARRGARARGVAAAPHPALPQAADDGADASRAGRSGSTTTASTSRTTCASPRCRSPGTWEQLLTLTGRIEAQLLDRVAPAVGAVVRRGARGRPASRSMQKTHHALVDGVSGVDVATVLLDFTPDPTCLDAAARGSVAGAEPSPAAARRHARRALDRADRDRALGPAPRPHAAARARRGPARSRARSARWSTAHRSRRARRSTSPVGRRRRFAGVRVPLADVKAIRAALGGTVNDVVLAGVAGGLRRLLESRGDDVPTSAARAVPGVGARRAASTCTSATGCRRCSWSCRSASPIRSTRLRRDRRADRATSRSASRRSAPRSSSTSREYAAPTLLGLAARLVHRQPFLNLVVTNVPGPQVPLYCMGARMLEAYPMVPLTRNLSLGVAILSYCGDAALRAVRRRRRRGPTSTMLAGDIDGRVRGAAASCAADDAHDRRRGRGSRMTELWEHDAWQLADAVRAGERLGGASCSTCRSTRIAARNDELNAVCFLDEDGARGARRRRSTPRSRAARTPGRSPACPIGVKELAQAKGFPNTHASVVFRDDVAAGDCTEVARLRAAGAVIVGLTTAPEWGIPSYTTSPLHGITRNPWNPERTPGGSSGGSAAAVAVGHVRRRAPAATAAARSASRRRTPGCPGSRRRSGGSATARTTRSTPASRRCSGPMVRSVRDAARYVDATSGPDAAPTPRRCRSPTPYEPIVADVDRGARPAARQARRVVVDARVRASATSTSRRATLATRPRQLVDDAGLELVDVPIVVPEAGPGVGRARRREHRGLVLRPQRRGSSTTSTSSRASRSRGCRTCARATSARAIRRRQEMLVAIGRAVRAGRPAAHADHADDRVPGRGHARRSRSTARSVDLHVSCRRRSPRRST